MSKVKSLEAKYEATCKLEFPGGVGGGGGGRCKTKTFHEGKYGYTFSGTAQYQYVYSLYCPSYISYTTSWEILSKNQCILHCIFGDYFLDSPDLNV